MMTISEKQEACCAELLAAMKRVSMSKTVEEARGLAYTSFCAIQKIILEGEAPNLQDLRTWVSEFKQSGPACPCCGVPNLKRTA